MTNVANASVIQFDLDGDSTKSFTADGAPFTNTVLMSELQLDATSNYTIQQNLGADNILGNGDTFTESFRLDMLSAQLGGTTTAGYSAFGQSLGYVDVVLSGNIDNYSNGGDGDTTATTGNIGNDVFDINVLGGSINFFYDPDFTPGTVDDVNFATGSNITGGATAFSFENTTATQAIGIEFDFTALLAGYMFDLGGNDLNAKIALNLVAGFGDGSVTILGGAGGVTGGDGNHFLGLTVADNGTTMQVEVPEPASIALLGLGLLGFGAVSRKKSA